MTLYACIDVRLKSELRLPELPIAGNDDDRAVVEVRIAALASSLADAAPPRGGLQVAGDVAQFEVPDVARYRVAEGREIVIDPAPGADAADVRLYLLGSALGLLSHQRGLLPLHANAFVSDGGAFAFAGPSGAGKSTLAAHFEQRGHTVLCDDLCVVGFDAEGRPEAWPGLPRLKLWGEAAAAFGLEPRGLTRAVGGLDKWHVPMSRPASRRPVRFRRLYVLERAPEGEPGRIRRLRGQDAMAAVRGNTYRGRYVADMGLADAHFRRCAALLEHIEVYAASRAWGYDVFEAEAARLERHVRGEATDER
ncbi:MAG: hypothetical protein ACXW3O_01780 [Brevundimonas sp.]